LYLKACDHVIEICHVDPTVIFCRHFRSPRSSCANQALELGQDTLQYRYVGMAGVTLLDLLSGSVFRRFLEEIEALIAQNNDIN